jgi:hypothetical protein
MERKDLHKLTSPTPPLVTDKPAPKADLESIIQTGGYQDGRLFFSRDKATYTFLNETEVVSLHFDLSKHDLYLKGHRIATLDDHAHLADFLLRFKKALSENPNAQHFVTAFDIAVAKLNRL